MTILLREDFFMARALIFVNGNLPDLAVIRRLILPDDFLIAADGGTAHILELGLIPAVLIGDLDSLSSENRLTLSHAGTTINQYPRNKNETDFELALHYAVNSGFRELRIIAALGGRLDQTLGNLSLLSDPSLSALDIRAEDGVQEAFFVFKECQLQGDPGDLVSLIPWGVKVSSITTTGLRWSLSGEDLWPNKSRGISNQMLEKTASVAISSGILLVVHSRQPNE
jgi:thiamine pyrophosphokinase